VSLENGYGELLEHHYARFWGQGKTRVLTRGPELLSKFQVFEFPRTEKTFSWVYATCGMTPLSSPELSEIYLLSPCQANAHVELLTAIAHYHQTGARIGWGHTVNFGRPWLGKSQCTFGLVSLPYHFGPSLEKVSLDGQSVRVLWLIPITFDERAFKIDHGLEALEQLFEAKQFNYLKPDRRSVVGK